MRRWREYRLRTARESLADAEEERRVWGFGMRPSERAWWDRRIERCRRRVERLDPTSRAKRD